MNKEEFSNTSPEILKMFYLEACILDDYSAEEDTDRASYLSDINHAKKEIEGWSEDYLKLVQNSYQCIQLYTAYITTVDIDEVILPPVEMPLAIMHAVHDSKDESGDKYKKLACKCLAKAVSNMLAESDPKVNRKDITAIIYIYLNNFGRHFFRYLMAAVDSLSIYAAVKQSNDDQNIYLENYFRYRTVLSANKGGLSL